MLGCNFTCQLANRGLLASELLLADLAAPLVGDAALGAGTVLYVFVRTPVLASTRIPFASSDVLSQATSFIPSHATRVMLLTTLAPVCAIFCSGLLCAFRYG